MRPNSASPEPSAPKRLADYTPPGYLIDEVDLNIDIRDDATTVTSKLDVRRNPDAAEGEPTTLHLDGEELELVDIKLDGKPLQPGDYTRTDTGLQIPGMPDDAQLEITTRIKPHENLRLEGLYKSNDLFVTQMEAEGFRRFTYYPDRPDVMAKFTTRVEGDADSLPVLLANGNQIDAGVTGEGRHYTTWRDPHPKPAYLFAVVAGDLVKVEDKYTTGSGREVNLAIFVEPGDEDKVAHAMDSLKRSMRWDEEVYGREYDLDTFHIVAANDFNAGAMENKGLNIFNTKYVLANPETATDNDFDGVEGVIAHEYFHNWTGNRVTVRDWFQLTLKEGLTVFRDQEFSADMGSRAVKRIDDVQGLRAGQFAEDAGPTAHPIQPKEYIEINNFYTATVYDKGAEIIRMMHTLVGEEGFRKGTDLYFDRHDNSAVTTEEFISSIEDANGIDLSQFRNWYDQAGTPNVDAKGTYDPATETFTLTLKQQTDPTPGQPEKKPFHIPVRMGLVGADGQDMALTVDGEAKGTETVLSLTEEEQTFTFTGVKEDPTPSLLRGFSAPVKLTTDLSEKQLQFLAGHDSDSFNRWEAAQTVNRHAMLSMIDDHKAGRALEMPPAMLEQMRENLSDPSLDGQYKALMLRTPSYTELSQAVDEVDPDAIQAVRKFVREELATKLAPEWRELSAATKATAPFEATGEQKGQRALHNLALGYMAANPRGKAVEQAVKQFGEADNMTERLAAFSTLVETKGPERQRAIDQFYDDFKDQPLVMDKWFALQAMSGRTDAAGLSKLMEHKDFSLTNPNRLRSVVGSFAAGNPENFHAKDGSGYKLLADVVLEVEKLNPRTAARLLSPMRQWRRFDGERQALMQKEMERIAAVPGLSKDVYEVVTKTLAAPPREPTMPKDAMPRLMSPDPIQVSPPKAAGDVPIDIEGFRKRREGGKPEGPSIRKP
ncbi:MAG: aminopeptidase N [Alphaproteobacteria bacterium]|nr:aminopeptidase N [Alphaproteobacteria bacterium SS10]